MVNYQVDPLRHMDESDQFYTEKKGHYLSSREGRVEWFSSRVCTDELARLKRRSRLSNFENVKRFVDRVE